MACVVPRSVPRSNAMPDLVHCPPAECAPSFPLEGGVVTRAELCAESTFLESEGPARETDKSCPGGEVRACRTATHECTRHMPPPSCHPVHSRRSLPTRAQPSKRPESVLPPQEGPFGDDTVGLLCSSGLSPAQLDRVLDSLILLPRCCADVEPRTDAGVRIAPTCCNAVVAALVDADLLRARNQDLEDALKKVTSDACRLRAECAGLREDVDVLVAQRDALRCELYGRHGPCVQSRPQSVLVLLASDSEDSDVEEGTDDGSEGRSKRLCCRAG